MKSLFRAVLVFVVAIPPIASFVSPAVAEVATFGKGAQVVVIDATDLTADRSAG